MARGTKKDAAEVLQIRQEVSDVQHIMMNSPRFEPTFHLEDIDVAETCRDVGHAMEALIQELARQPPHDASWQGPDSAEDAASRPQLPRYGRRDGTRGDPDPGKSNRLRSECPIGTVQIGHAVMLSYAGRLPLQHLVLSGPKEGTASARHCKAAGVLKERVC